MAPSQQPTQQAELNHIEFCQDNFQDQLQSPLFSTLSAEIRERIFEFALADFEDWSRPYDLTTCYRRPTQMAPRKSDTALLRTCQRVYNEAWFRPWASAEHHFWFTANDRRPPNALTQEKMQSCLDLLRRLHGDVELNHIVICAQLWALESGGQMIQLLSLSHFCPQYITVTVRHTDFWYWESDQPLRVGGAWVERVVFPASVKELRLELETLQRKKNQLDNIAAQMVDKWEFRTSDGAVLSAKGNKIDTMTWSGTSIWDGKRWTRDETRPETLDYYVVTVRFRPVHKRSEEMGLHAETDHTAQTAEPVRVEQDDEGAEEIPSTDDHETIYDSDYDSDQDSYEGDIVMSCDVVFSEHYVPMSGNPHIYVVALEQAGVPPGTSAEDADRMIRHWHDERRRQQQLNMRTD